MNDTCELTTKHHSDKILFVSQLTVISLTPPNHSPYLLFMDVRGNQLLVFIINYRLLLVNWNKIEFTNHLM